MVQPWEKAKKEKLETKTDRRKKRIKYMKVIFVDLT